eukprot:468756_1
MKSSTKPSLARLKILAALPPPKTHRVCASEGNITSQSLINHAADHSRDSLNHAAGHRRPSVDSTQSAPSCLDDWLTDSSLGSSGGRTVFDVFDSDDEFGGCVTQCRACVVQ